MQRWDIFCRVIDNFGDIGTCWRLARQLVEEHHVHVRLWVDQLDSFAKLCPSISTAALQQNVGQIEVRLWSAPFPEIEVAEVVIEAFACEIPETYVAAMARCETAPIWINLEYLSAETWVDECHLLKSPHPRWPLTKYFFFPGFTSQTGGLLREYGLLGERTMFDRIAENEFWRACGVPCRGDDELRVSLFCYDNAALPGLLSRWAGGPEAVRVLATPGAATHQVATWLRTNVSPGETLANGKLTVHTLPFLPQREYDRLLWSCDVNFVRGEDSFVRAQWAGRPFVWQIYPQARDAHHTKLDAFLSRFTEGLGAAESAAVQQFWWAWNGREEVRPAWNAFVAARTVVHLHGKDWAVQLDRQDDLANNLARLVRDL